MTLARCLCVESQQSELARKRPFNSLIRQAVQGIPLDISQPSPSRNPRSASAAESARSAPQLAAARHGAIVLRAQ